jgi:hypothetical protein
VIDAYVNSLLGALRHDRSLARRLRREVEDHLWEAVAADPSEESREAQRRAIASFGDPRLIAAQFAAVSLEKQTRRTGIAVVLIVAGVYITMKARVAWYALMECAITNDIAAVAQLVGVHRPLFVLAFRRSRGGVLGVLQSRPPPSLS